QLLKAIFLDPGPFSDAAFLPTVQAMAQLVLNLSDTAARRAGLPRGTHAIHGHGKRVQVPSADRFQLLKGAVMFSREQMSAQLDQANASCSHLEPLLTHGSAPPSGIDALEQIDVSRTPILVLADAYILVAPAALLA